MEFMQTLIEFLSSDGWVLLVLLGTLLAVLAFYFRQQTLKLRHSISQLYHINEHCQQDALEFFHQSWPLLKRSGCLSLQADVSWFGETIKITQGDNSAKAFRYDFVSKVDDMVFDVSAFLSYSGQQPESIARVILITFEHILEQDLMLKQSQILVSQKRLERYQLFVQHEIKNIAQFLQLFSDQVKQIDTDQQRLKLFYRLEKSLPQMAQRAKNTLSQTHKPQQLLISEWFAVERVLLDIIEMHSLEVKIDGSAQVYLPRNLMIEVFKNILGNYRDHGLDKQPIEISIKTNQGCLKITIASAIQFAKQIPASRMFEPFWSNSESGMGLGLFLCRELLKLVGGSVNFQSDQTSQTAAFQIVIPLKNMTNQQSTSK